MAKNPGVTKQTQSKPALGTLPTNWRTKLPERLTKVPFTRLSMAFDDASAVLLGRSDAEVQQIAQDLQRLIVKNLPMPSAKGTGHQVIEVGPRTIYALHAPFNAEDSLDLTALGNHLAVATLLELLRASDLYSDAQDKPSWVKAAQAVANASALSEWIYVTHTLLAGVHQVVPSRSRQENRAAVKAKVKAKVKKAKSEAAKKGWRKRYKFSKQLVIDYFEQHKAEFKSLAQAAKAIKQAKLVLKEYSTIYQWLLKHAKKAKT